MEYHETTVVYRCNPTRKLLKNAPHSLQNNTFKLLLLSDQQAKRYLLNLENSFESSFATVNLIDESIIKILAIKFFGDLSSSWSVYHGTSRF